MQNEEVKIKKEEGKNQQPISSIVLNPVYRLLLTTL